MPFPPPPSTEASDAPPPFPGEQGTVNAPAPSSSLSLEDQLAIAINNLYQSFMLPRHQFEAYLPTILEPKYLPTALTPSTQARVTQTIWSGLFLALLKAIPENPIAEDRLRIFFEHHASCRKEALAREDGNLIGYNLITDDAISQAFFNAIGSNPPNINQLQTLLDIPFLRWKLGHDAPHIFQGICHQLFLYKNAEIVRTFFFTITVNEQGKRVLKLRFNMNAVTAGISYTHFSVDPAFFLQELSLLKRARLITLSSLLSNLIQVHAKDLNDYYSIMKNAPSLTDDPAFTARLDDLKSYRLVTAIITAPENTVTDFTFFIEPLRWAVRKDALNVIICILNRKGVDRTRYFEASRVILGEILNKYQESQAPSHQQDPQAALKPMPLDWQNVIITFVRNDPAFFSMTLISAVEENQVELILPLLLEAATYANRDNQPESDIFIPNLLKECLQIVTKKLPHLSKLPRAEQPMAIEKISSILTLLLNFSEQQNRPNGKLDLSILETLLSASKSFPSIKSLLVAYQQKHYPETVVVAKPSGFTAFFASLSNSGGQKGSGDAALLKAVGRSFSGSSGSSSSEEGGYRQSLDAPAQPSATNSLYKGL